MENSEMTVIARHMSSAPVDLKAIFRDLGITYEERCMSGGASGSITRSGDDFIIAVNSMESDNRQRFTAAHELAHYLLHRDLMGDGKKMHHHIDSLYGGGEPDGDVVFKRTHEIQANRIAAQIVMPAQLVVQEYKRKPDAATLANKFGVSKAAMEIRLKTLGLT